MSKNMYDENGILKSNVTEIEDKVKTDFGKGIVYIGSKEYNDYYYPKFDEKGMHR